MPPAEPGGDSPTPSTSGGARDAASHPAPRQRRDTPYNPAIRFRETPTPPVPWLRSVDTAAKLHPPSIVPCWYIVAPSRAVAPGEARRFEIGARSVVVFRGRDSRTLHALAPHCLHQGVDLSRGYVVGDRLRCPLHHWEYGDACEAIPGRAEVPPELRARHFTVAEKYGAIFVHPGAEPRTPLPSFRSVDPDTLHFVAGEPATLGCPWYVPVANAFDMSHLGTVHRRRLRSAPEVERPDPMTFVIRYSTSVTGDGLSDRAMRWLSRDDIRVEVTCAGGTTVVVEATVGSRRSFLMVSLRPVPGGVSLLPVVGVPRRAGGLHRIHARLAMSLFVAFLRRDVKALDGIQFSPRFDGDRDAMLEQFYEYLCSLPDLERKETS